MKMSSSGNSDSSSQTEPNLGKWKQTAAVVRRTVGFFWIVTTIFVLEILGDILIGVSRVLVDCCKQWHDQTGQVRKVVINEEV